ncbi:Clathrin light chain [Ceratocystis fimbriata CBS 114723]|uniref:Clathrin light chain n=2 Tax=Ceratocystis TaxID=5157 RepID=A0A0F8DJR4_CERFI|nr:Clathrin light chain [Ceratocystis platani]PHH51370.1 Clathrin light chain [Ceratocystis fimbriata CBS 114723]
MADRFPSLEEFDSGATQVRETSGEVPSTDDFLAREKALLGDDADQFATNDDDLLAENEAASPEAAFTSQFPDITANQSVSNDGTITGAGPSVSYNSGFSSYAQEEEEPEVIKQWRETRDANNAKRAEKFAQQREETIKEARQNIDDFYENYNLKKDKTISQTQKDSEEFLANRENTVSGGTSWERIAKLVDVSGKGVKGGASGSGKERFRELLVSLKKDENAPGASGY